MTRRWLNLQGLRIRSVALAFPPPPESQLNSTMTPMRDLRFRFPSKQRAPALPLWPLMALVQGLTMSSVPTLHPPIFSSSRATSAITDERLLRTARSRSGYVRFRAAKARELGAEANSCLGNPQCTLRVHERRLGRPLALPHQPVCHQRRDRPRFLRCRASRD